MPPQNLQTTPVAAAATVASNGLGEHAAALVANANPAEMAQQHAAWQQSRAQPFTALVLELEPAFRVHSQSTVAPVGAPLSLDVTATCDEPQACSKDSGQEWQGHRQDQDNADEHQAKA